MDIRQLHELNDTQFEEIKALLAVLSSHCEPSREVLEEALSKSRLYVMEDHGHIIGMASLCVFTSPTGRKASIEDVVILPTQQGKGLGRQLMEHVIGEAQKLSPITLHLTSRPTRVAANALYRKLDFQQKETNVYTLRLASLS